MTVYTNSAAGGTNGTTVTTGNSGGASGTAFDVVNLFGAGAALVFDNAHSTMAYKYTTGTASSAGGFVQWNITGHDVSGSVDVYLTANPLADNTLVQLAWTDGVTTANMLLRITTTGKLTLFDGNAAHTKFTTTNSVPLNTWCKVTFAIHTLNDPNGSYDVRLYPNLVTGTPTETQAGTATWMTSGDATVIYFGSCNTWKDPSTGAVLGSGSYWLGNLSTTDSGAPAITYKSDADTVAATDTAGLPVFPIADGPYFNDAAGGVNGVAVSTANTGGASGSTLYDHVYGTSAVTFDNSHGTMAYKFVNGTTVDDIARVSFRPADTGLYTERYMSGSVRLYLTGSPGAEYFLVIVDTSWSPLFIGVTPAGKLSFRAGLAVDPVYVTTAGIPLNTWCRVEFEFNYLTAPVASYQVRLYADTTTSVPLESFAGSLPWIPSDHVDTYGRGARNVLFGGSGANPYTWFADNLTVDSAPPPVLITTLTPAEVSTAGGTAVTITGERLTGVVDVTVAGASRPFTIVDDTTITFYTAAHAPGTYDVSVSIPDEVPFTLADSFTFTGSVVAPTAVTGMRLPFTLPASLPGADLTTGGLYTPSGPRYNYAVGGLPFLSAASPENPLVRETVPIRKQQYDTANVPGEQSLEGWWLRSQQTFHGGAGQDYADPVGSAYNIDSSPLTRFKASRNVDVWTPGKVTLLNSVETHTDMAGMVDITEFVYGDGTAGVMAIDDDGGCTQIWGYGITKHLRFMVGSALLQTVTCDGSYMYVAGGLGVWSAPIPVTHGGTFVWTQIYSVAAFPQLHLSFVKQRLMLGAGPNVYELVPHPVSPPVAVASPKYTALDPNWRWCSFTESGSAIYAVGNNGVRGSILKFVLAADGSIPVLSGAAVAAQLPAGEVPYSALGYLGSFVGLGTSKGARVAVADSNGDLTYGPLIFTTTEPVRCWTARDRFLFCAATGAIDGQSGVCRIDLATQISDLRFAYATDLNALADTSTCRVVANLGDTDKIVYGTDVAMYLEDDRTLATSGYLLTSRVRFGTLEPKLFKRVKVRGPALVGAISFQVLDEGDHPAGSYTYRLGRGPGETEAAITSPSTPQDFVSLKFTLQTGTAGGGGEFWGYQLMALPGAQRQRMIQLPVWCFDWERDGKGQRRGATGSAFQRLSQLEALEKAGSAVVFQDLDNRVNTNCVIEQVSFKQTTPPEYMDGLGGIVTLTLRTV